MTHTAKRMAVALAAVCSSVTFSMAQEAVAQKPPARSMAVGCNINSYGGNFGVGVNVTSPLFLHGYAAVRASENYQWLDHIDATGNHTWTGYHVLKLGAVGIGGTLHDIIRLYGEGGVTAVLPDASMSKESAVIGGYGLFGFEFMVRHNLVYFIELGGIGTGATAEKLPQKPIYTNGFMASAGLRVHL